MKEVIFKAAVIEDLSSWSIENPKLVKKVFDLLLDIQRNPFKGIGKPEPLKYKLKGYWSRRINEEHRLIYGIESNEIIIVLSVHGHYDE